MIRNGETSLDAAAERLSHALDSLEARLAEHEARLAAAPPSASEPADDAVHIALREARLRERALEAAAAEASVVLGRAAERIQLALEEAVEEEGPELDNDPADAGTLDDLSDDQTDLHPNARGF